MRSLSRHWLLQFLWNRPSCWKTAQTHTGKSRITRKERVWKQEGTIVEGTYRKSLDFIIESARWGEGESGRYMGNGHYRGNHWDERAPLLLGGNIGQLTPSSPSRLNQPHFKPKPQSIQLIYPCQFTLPDAGYLPRGTHASSHQLGLQHRGTALGSKLLSPSLGRLKHVVLARISSSDTVGDGWERQRDVFGKESSPKLNRNHRDRLSRDLSSLLLSYIFIHILLRHSSRFFWQTHLDIQMGDVQIQMRGVPSMEVK